MSYFMQLMNVIKIIFRITVLGLFFIISLIIGTLGYLHTHHAQTWILQALNENIPGFIQIKTIELSLIQGKLSLHDLMIKNEKNDLLAGFEKFDLCIEPLSLITGTIHFKEIFFQHPYAFIDIDQSGKINLLTALNLNQKNESHKESSGFDVTKMIHVIVDNLCISDANIHYKDQDIHLDLPHITIKGLGDSYDYYAGIDITIQSGSLTQKDHAPYLLDFHTHMDWNHGIVQVSAFDLNLDSYHVSLSGHGNYPNKHINFSGYVQSNSMGILLSKWGISDVRGQLNANFNISGFYTQPHMRWSVNLHDVGYETISIGNINLLGTLNSKGVLALKQMELENQGSLIQGAGSIQLFKESLSLHEDMPFSLTLIAHDIETYDFYPLPPARGHIKGSVQCTGNRRNVKGSINLIARDFAILSYRLGDFDLTANLDEGIVYLSCLKIHNQQSILEMSGSSLIFDGQTFQPILNFPFTLDIKGERILLEDFFDHFQGNIQLHATVSGSSNNPDGKLSLKAKNLQIGMQRIHAIQCEATIKQNNVTVDKLLIALSESETLTGIGSYKLKDQTYSFDIHSKGISFAQIAPLKDIPDIQGRFGMSFSGKGNVSNPMIKGRVWIDPLVYQKTSFQPIQINLLFKDQTVTFTGKQDFQLTGTCHVKTGEFQSLVIFDKTNMDSIVSLFDLKLIKGYFSGTSIIQGNIYRSESINATFDLSKINITVGSKPTAYIKYLKAQYTKQHIVINPFLIQLFKKSQLSLSGNLSDFTTLNAKASGLIPLSILRPWLQDYPDITGNIEISAMIQGPIKNPTYQIDLSLKQISVTIPQLNQKMHTVNGRIEINPNAIVVKQINGLLDTGHFSAKGNIELNQFTPQHVAMTLKMNSLPIRIADTLDVLIQSELTLQGNPNESKVSGSIVLLEGLYYRDVSLNLLNLVTQKKRKPVNHYPKPIDWPYLKNMQLNISLTQRNPFLIENNIASIELIPDLTIIGVLHRPIIQGRAKIIEGLLTYQKKQFVVKKGIIDFINPYRIEPEIDIEGEIEIRDWLILLSISGTSENLSFKLDSTPPEEHADLLSLLLVGKTTKELITGEGGSSQSTAQLLAETIASTFGEDVKRTTGLDFFQVESTGKSESQGLDRVKVTLGKRLSRRMMVKYSIESKDNEIIQRATTEYNILENLLLKGFQDTSGQFGGELQFRLEFR